MTNNDVLFAELPGKTANIGLITLNRPNALNALNKQMCIDIDKKLQEWEQSPNIKAIVIRGAGDRAFCAGGDIRNIYEHRGEPVEKICEFFWYEYRLYHRIYHLRKPYISLLNGLTMGGGAGISVNGSHRVATEKLNFSMPETGIGFFPDVGASYFLPRCPGKTGIYLALSGVTIDAANTHYLGLANYYVASSRLEELLDKLTATAFQHNNAKASVDQIINSLQSSPAQSTLKEHRKLIDDCFSKSSVEEILQTLQSSQNVWGQELAALIQKKSPTSLVVTFEEMKRGGDLNFDDCVRMEYRMAMHFVQSHDFFEGVRAAIIDKDRNPKWQPNQLQDVSVAEVERYFTNLGQDELFVD